jgi:hypothetical protein
MGHGRMLSIIEPKRYLSNKFLEMETTAIKLKLANDDLMTLIKNSKDTMPKKDSSTTASKKDSNNLDEAD